MCRSVLAFLLLLTVLAGTAQSSFVRTRNHQLVLDGQPYYFTGCNYWYGGLLALEPDRSRGIDRLRRELDFLQSRGIRNLRVLGGAEGEGLIQDIQRVGPALQPQKGIFDTSRLTGLDVLLDELARRRMKAVIYLSNNWEWSGGFLQYLNWNGQLPDSLLLKRMSWDQLRDEQSRFYQCQPCMEDYLQQVAVILNRSNSVNGRRYIDDPAIMSWELANEPRPMRPAAVPAYLHWVATAAAFIKAKDPRHLVTAGHEGYIGAENIEVFQAVHAFRHIDYLTIHIWPKNWQWFHPDSLSYQLPQVFARTDQYILPHLQVARDLKKPLVIEEFGLPRDGLQFSPAVATRLRDRYYEHVFSFLTRSRQTGDVVAGANFWAFGGTARPVANQVFWKKGDDYMGDPPMEEQGLNTVFDSDASTWKIIERAAQPLPAAATSRKRRR